MSRRGRPAARVLLLIAVAGLLLSACGRSLPQNTLDPAGPIADKAKSLFDIVFWIAVGVFVLVEGLLLVIMVRYRHRRNARIPKQVHGNRRLEITWTFIPTAILAGVAVITIPVIFQFARPPGPGALEIHVTGHQWWWEAQYPQLKVTTANEIHIPVNRWIEFSLTSNDVIHSFWVPRLAGKQDLEPGHDQHLKLFAQTPGTYFGQCAEFCGLSHANMRLRVIVQTPDEFTAWVNSELQPAQPPPADVLQDMTTAGCGGCHTIDGVQNFVGTVGPNLTHFASRSTFAGATYPNDPDHVHAWVQDAPSLKPGSDMPSFVGKLSPDQVSAVVSYLESLH